MTNLSKRYSLLTIQFLFRQVNCHLIIFTCTILWTPLHVDIHSFKSITCPSCYVWFCSPSAGGFCIHWFQQLLWDGCRGGQTKAWIEILWLWRWRNLCLKGLSVILLDLLKLHNLCIFPTSSLSKDLDIVSWNKSCGLPINTGHQPASHFGLLPWTQDKTLENNYTQHCNTFWNKPLCKNSPASHVNYYCEYDYYQHLAGLLPVVNLSKRF